MRNLSPTIKALQKKLHEIRLKELEEQGIINRFTTTEKKEGKAIIDVVYTIQASMSFIAEQKASNKKNREAISEAHEKNTNIHQRYRK